MMKMKITKWEEMTVGDYQELFEICKNSVDDMDTEISITGLLCGVEEKDILALPIREFAELKKQAAFIKEMPKNRPSCPKTITLCGRKYTVTREPEKMGVGQYIDFQAYSREDFITVLPQLLSCFLVPEGKTYGEGYEQSEVHKDIADGMNILVAFGMSAFFLRRFLRLTNATLSYSERMIRKAMKKMGKKEREETKRRIQEIRSRISGDGLKV